MKSQAQTIQNVVISSLQVAASLGKRHDHILRMIKNNAPIKGVFETSYKDGKGQFRTMYMMNRDGFCYVVLGTTGKHCWKWKQAFIKAFNSVDRMALGIVTDAKGGRGYGTYDNDRREVICRG